MILIGPKTIQTPGNNGKPRESLVFEENESNKLMSTIKHLFTNSTCEANNEAIVSVGSGPSTSRGQND